MPATELVVCDMGSAEQTVLGLVIAADCVPGNLTGMYLITHYTYYILIRKWCIMWGEVLKFCVYEGVECMVCVCVCFGCVLRV